MQYLAEVLTNDALSDRLQSIVVAPRQFDKEEREAYMLEASKRLRWYGRQGCAIPQKTEKP